MAEERQNILIDKSRSLFDYRGVFVVDTKGHIASICNGMFCYGQEGTTDMLGIPNYGEGNGFDINDEHRVIGGANDDPYEQDETKRISTPLENAKKILLRND